MKPKKKYGLLMGDTHCGHLVGLTPESWAVTYSPLSTTKRRKWAYICRALWSAFDEILHELPKLDFVVANGDLIDGKGKKSGGTELITSDMNEQCEMAISVLKHVKKFCKKDAPFFGTYGTDYHSSSDGDEWENIIAKAVLDSIGSHEWINVNGCVLDIKHKESSSTVPYSRHTGPAKSGIWNNIWAMRDEQPKADLLIRSHVHYYSYCETPDYAALTLPALQGMGSRYGAKQCIGTVDWGVVLIEIFPDGNFMLHPKLRKIKEQKTKAVVI